MGGGAHLGGEDGRSRGGTVILSVPWGGWRTIVVSFLAFILVANLVACSRQSVAPQPDAANILQGISPADPAKYPSLHGAKHWSNPYLVIRADRVGMLSGVAASEEQVLKPEEVLNALAQLPATAWPYGRAVAVLVEEKPGMAEAEKIALRRNRGIVEGDLQNAHVAIRWIATS